MNNPTTPKHICKTIARRGLSEEDIERLKHHKAAILKDASWSSGEQISISFLDGSSFLQEKVKEFANEWVANDAANLNFLWKSSQPSDIRIAFVQGDGSWSNMGVDCRKVTDQAEPTMNFGWLTDESTDQEIRSVVLHEFGHALGFIHEHLRPDANISWNKEAVIADLSGPPDNWSRQEIEDNVFNHYSEEQVTRTSEFDRYSIMVYEIPESWTTNGFATFLNNDLSDEDKQLARAVYS